MTGKTSLPAPTSPATGPSSPTKKRTQEAASIVDNPRDSKKQRVIPIAIPTNADPMPSTASSITTGSANTSLSSLSNARTSSGKLTPFNPRTCVAFDPAMRLIVLFSRLSFVYTLSQVAYIWFITILTFYPNSKPLQPKRSECRCPSLAQKEKHGVTLAKSFSPSRPVSVTLAASPTLPA